MAARLTPAYQTFNTANGSSPLAGGKIHFYVSGSVSTNKDTFSDSTLLTANTNPLVLDSAGRVQVDVWGSGAYKMVVADSSDAVISTFDPIAGSFFATALNTIAGMTALTKSVLADGDQVNVSGYYAQGDGGGGEFYWDSSSSDTADGVLIFASDEGGSGRWNRIITDALTSIMAGIVADTTDQSVQLQAFFNAAADLKILAGDYVSESALTIPYGVNIDAEPGSHIDFSSASIAGNFPNNYCLNAGAGTLTALPSLSVSPAKGAISVTFASAPSVVQGQIINFNDPTASSWNGARTNYRKGEFARVARVTSTVVLLDGPLFDSYDHTVIGMNLVNGGTINITGSLDVTGVALNSIGTFNGSRLIDSNISGLYATNSRNAEISFAQCFNVSGSGLVGQQTINSGLGLQYGLAVSNSQHMYLSGSFSGTRHGSTVGGADIVGSIVNRDVVIRGNISSNDGGVAAADHHGNCEFCVYDGVFQGGISAAGDNNKYRGSTYAKPDGVVVGMTEMLGWSFDFSGLNMFSNGDPTLVVRGVFDLGGNSNAADANTTRGGTLDLSNITMSAPNAKSLVTIRNRGSVTTDNISVNLNGANFIDFDATPTTGIFVGKVSGDDINLMTTYGITFGGTIAHSITGLDVLLGFEENRIFNQATAGGSAAESFAISFDRTFPIAPTVMAAPEIAGYGAGILLANVTSVTTTGFTLTLSLASGSNLPANNTDIMYQASTGTL